jgi:hypothetical protein
MKTNPVFRLAATVLTTLAILGGSAVVAAPAANAATCQDAAKTMKAGATIPYGDPCNYTQDKLAKKISADRQRMFNLIMNNNSEANQNLVRRVLLADFVAVARHLSSRSYPLSSFQETAQAIPNRAITYRYIYQSFSMLEFTAMFLHQARGNTDAIYDTIAIANKAIDVALNATKKANPAMRIVKYEVDQCFKIVAGSKSVANYTVASSVASVIVPGYFSVGNYI